MKGYFFISIIFSDTNITPYGESGIFLTKGKNSLRVFKKKLKFSDFKFSYDYNFTKIVYVFALKIRDYNRLLID